MSGHPEYPECEKLKELQPFSQKCGEFLEWLRNEKGVSLLKYNKEERIHYPVYQPTDRLVAEFFGIDLDKVESEKRAMLEWLRNKDVCQVCHSRRDEEGRCRCRGNNIGYVDEEQRPEVEV